MNEHLHALPAGHRLGEYRIERVLGDGGFGITYYARDIDIGKQVAIKEYFPSDFAVRTDGATVKPKSTDDQETYQWGLERVLGEARALAHFKHPHINEVYRLFEDNGTAYIVLEYIEGETLEQLLQREGQLDAVPLRRLLEELLSGLEKVHQAGFVHRDIKPENIMLRENGDAVLLDFGAARQAVGRRSKSITAILTPGYAPIEQYDLKGDDIGPWTDLYTLGMVAYRCISGISKSDLPGAVERALPAHKNEQSKDLTPAVEVARGRYDTSLLKAVDWAIQVHKEQRPQSVAAWREALVGGDESDETASDAAQSSEVLDAVAPSPPKSAEDTAGSEKEAEAQRKRFAKVFGRDPSPHTKDADGLTDLHYVAAANMSALARLLLNAGADIHARMKEDAKPMTDTSKKKLQQLTKADFWFYRCSPTPLHLAARCNALDTAKLLISRGVDIQAKDKYGTTPLHWAARKTNALDAAALLITFEADVQAKDKDGDTPLHSAAQGNALDTAKLLISRGANVQEKNKYDSTPLHFTAYNNALDAAKLLISRGANAQAKDKYGNTPLHWAAQHNALDIAKLLISRGVDIQAKNKDGNTPLHWAAQHNALDTAKLLISHRVNVQAKNKYDSTPLHWAAEKNALDTAKLLISCGVDIQAKDKYGETPLHEAAKGDARETAQLLISHGADMRAQDKRRRTPRDIAIKYDYSEMAQTLKPKALKVGMAGIAWRVAIIPVLVGTLMALQASIDIPENPVILGIVGVVAITAGIAFMGGFLLFDFGGDPEARFPAILLLSLGGGVLIAVGDITTFVLGWLAAIIAALKAFVTYDGFSSIYLSVAMASLLALMVGCVYIPMGIVAIFLITKVLLLFATVQAMFSLIRALMKTLKD